MRSCFDCELRVVSLAIHRSFVRILKLANLKFCKFAIYRVSSHALTIQVYILQNYNYAVCASIRALMHPLAGHSVVDFCCSVPEGTKRRRDPGSILTACHRGSLFRTRLSALRMILCMYPCVIVLFDRVNIIQDKTRIPKSL